MGESQSKKICMCGREVEDSSPSMFICIYCNIKHIEKADFLEKARKKCMCGNAKNPNDVQCYFCEEKDKDKTLK